MARQRIAVLGGGMGSLSAVFELTSRPDWQSRYEITVYQQGWLLGGKGASVRNRNDHHRIEEHGLHIWMGFYENAFKQIRACYDELGRKPGQPLARWDDAFKKHSFIVLEERLENGGWMHWRQDFPTNSSKPGSGGRLPSRVDYVSMALQSLVNVLIEFDRASHPGYEGRGGELRGFIRELASLTRTWVKSWKVASAAMTLSMGIATRQAAKAQLLPARLNELLTGVWKRVESELNTNADARRHWIWADFTIANIVGMIREGLLAPGTDFASIDHMEYRDWLRKHGASELTVNSAPIRALYGLIFSWEQGTGAGTMLYGMMRMMLTYKGAIFYKMQAGMGETVFTPLYEVLRRRGVRFRFFHRVKKLSVCGNAVDSIRVGVQARVKGGEEYRPLIEVEGLGCWPEQPLFEQLDGAEELRARRTSVETQCSEWGEREELVLRRGEDFDLALLGIPVGALAPICSELADADPRWRGMLENLRTTGTQAAQLWFKRDLRSLGWAMPSPVLGTYADPLDTWADMTHLLPLERWPKGSDVKSLAYLCGPLPDPVEGQDVGAAAVRLTAEKWVSENACHLFPEATTADGSFDWSLLHDPRERRGADRLKAQYFRANLEPSDRYVLSVPGSTRHRLAAHDSGFLNLYLAGDWVRTGLDAGCIEAAVMSGMQASRAICGYPKAIVGEPPGFEKQLSEKPRPLRAEYVERPGDLALRAPYRLEGAKLYSFALSAEKARLQEIVDRQLNRPTGGALRFSVAAPLVLLNCAFCSRIGSDDPEHRDRGWMPEADIAFWVPLWAMRNVRGAWVPDRLTWFLPFVFVDSDAAAYAGREVYGFPKVTATIRLERDSEGAPTRIAVETDVLRAFGADSGVERARVLEVSLANGAPAGGRLARLWKTLDESVTAQAFGAMKKWFDHGPGFGGQVRTVFLKQFRDAEDSRLACYQAVVEATARVTGFRAGGKLSGDYRVQVESFASHPLTEQLGIAPDSEPLHATWLDFDFRFEAGRELWRAP